jgi:two-component system, sensor histidine kinase and response regulator
MTTINREALRRVLERWVGRPPAGAEPAAPPRDGAPAAPIDVMALCRWIGGDTRLLVELVGIFLEDLPERRRELREAVRDRRSSEVERAAHSLKGALANFGASTAVSLAERLEGMGRTAELADTAPVLAQFDAELDRLAVFLADPGWRARLPAAEPRDAR